MRLALPILCLITFSGLFAQNKVLRFDFGGTENGLEVSQKTQWPFLKNQLTYGLHEAERVKHIKKGMARGFLTADRPFFFSVGLPEGNYLVSVKLGDTEGTSNTTIKAESRRLMLYDYSTAKGKTETVSFVVNIRSARINEKDSIRLKKREFDYLNWDNRLTLEFSGKRPCIDELSIQRLTDIPTIFLTGNSTVVDQDKEPWASWGQMFPLFLKPEIAVANYAESGETLKAFIREKRLEKIASQIKAGDYLLMEFAHNDQKPGGNHVEPYTSYQEYLLKFINLANENGATPVLVTSTNRRVFDENGMIKNTLEEYPEAMRQLAKEQSLLLIDLNAMSKKLYEALGPERSKKAFVHYPANTFEWQKEALADNTHFSTYGAYELAKCVVQAIKESDSTLKQYLKDDLTAFDPNSPDDHAHWKWPLSEKGSSSKPTGY